MAGCEMGEGVIWVTFAEACEDTFLETNRLMLHIDSSIKEVKRTILFKNIYELTWSLVFDGLLLEDEATLVGLGIVDGDVIYVGEKGSFRNIWHFKNRVAEDISVGLNVLLGEEGFEVICKVVEFKIHLLPCS